MKQSRLTSMVEGNIFKQILLFSIPLFLGNLFQLLYNTVDSVVVGQYVGSNALAAVGASTPLINLLIGFFMGIASGAGVIVSRYFGAKKDGELSITIHTFMLFTIYFSVLVTVLGLFLSPILLSALNTPENIFNDANVYLQIYFAGTIVTMIYNSGAGVLRAVGDSRRPLYFLIVSSVINVVLDLYFVIELKMGVSGVAWATLIAQSVAAILVLIVLFRGHEVYRLYWNKLKIHKGALQEIVRVGIPAGLQQAIVSFSNVLVQAYVNQFGYAAIAGFSSGNKFDNFLALPINSIALSITTFTGQNIGAKRIDRMTKGIKVSLWMSSAVTLIIGVFAFINAELCIQLFSDEVDVIYYGALMMRTVIPFYVFLGVSQILCSAIRGAGISTIPMYINVFSFCVVRQIFLMITMPIFNDVQVVFASYSFTWLISCLIVVVYYIKGNWRKRLTGD